MLNLVKRTISGVAFILIMIGSLLWNKYSYAAMMIFVLVIMMKEFLSMTMRNKYRISQSLAILSSLVLFLLIYLYKGFNMAGKFLPLVFIPLLIIMINSLYVKDKKEFGKFACLYTSLIYIALPWSFINIAVFSPEGDYTGKLLLAFFIIVWASDVGGYIFGLAFGQKYGKKLFPSISPKKSWIGFWGGLGMAIVAAVILHFLGMLPFPLIHCIILAIIMNVTGVYGDLIESQWKRYYKIKDSGTSMPGHGGLLDRFDSSLTAIPAGVIYLIMFNFL